MVFSHHRSPIQASSVNSNANLGLHAIGSGAQERVIGRLRIQRFAVLAKELVARKLVQL